MPIFLDSDFRDWYDFAFDKGGERFERISSGGMSRPAMLRFLQSLGLNVPEHGKVKDVVEHIVREELSDFGDLVEQALSCMVDLVVFTDLRAHRGEGKQRMNAALAYRQFPEAYCCRFLPTGRGAGSHSLRYLQVGERKWWLRYESSNDWRSNSGDVDARLLFEEQPGFHPDISEALFAIDFVPAQQLFAVDFNIAPGLEPLNGVVSASEIVAEISKGVARQKALKTASMRFLQMQVS